MSEKFLSPNQNWPNFGGFGGLGVRWYKKFRFLLQKAHLCLNPRRLSHFCDGWLKGLTSRHLSKKKAESYRTSHWNDVPPLTLMQPVILPHYYSHFTTVWILSGTIRVSQYQKDNTKANLYFLEQETVSGRGITWAIRKFAPCPGQPCQHLSTQYLQAGCPSCHPTNSIKALPDGYSRPHI